jgi:hypothetical protein
MSLTTGLFYLLRLTYGQTGAVCKTFVGGTAEHPPMEPMMEAFNPEVKRKHLDLRANESPSTF